MGNCQSGCEASVIQGDFLGKLERFQINGAIDKKKKKMEDSAKFLMLEHCGRVPLFKAAITEIIILTMDQMALAGSDELAKNYHNSHFPSCLTGYFTVFKLIVLALSLQNPTLISVIFSASPLIK